MQQLLEMENTSLASTAEENRQKASKIQPQQMSALQGASDRHLRQKTPHDQCWQEEMDRSSMGRRPKI